MVDKEGLTQGLQYHLVESLARRCAQRVAGPPVAEGADHRTNDASDVRPGVRAVALHGQADEQVVGWRVQHDDLGSTPAIFRGCVPIHKKSFTIHSG